jgi:DNA polymerase III subunit gamma/tau
VVQTLEEVPDELALTPEADARLAEQAQRVPRATVVRLLELIGSALESVRAGADARTSLELALVKAARPEVDASSKALLARIQRLEAGQAATAPAEAGHAATAPAAPARAGHAAPDLADPEPAPVKRAGPDGRGAAADPAPKLGDRGAHADRATAPRDPADALPTASEPEDAIAPVVERPEDLQTLIDLWPAVIELVETGNRLVGAVIANATPVDLDGEDLTVAFPTSASFSKKKAEDAVNRQLVTDALRQLAGGRWRISYELREDLEAANGDHAPRACTEEELIERFKSELDAEELSIEPESGREPASAAGERGEA